MFTIPNYLFFAPKNVQLQMKDHQSYQRISDLLFVIAAILMLISLYFKSQGLQNIQLDIYSWLSLLVAAIVGIYVANLKQNQDA